VFSYALCCSLCFAVCALSCVVCCVVFCVWSNARAWLDDDRKSKCVQLSGEGRIQIDFIAFLVEIIVSLE
jgi:hypothetical protein